MTNHILYISLCSYVHSEQMGVDFFLFLNSLQPVIPHNHNPFPVHLIRGKWPDGQVSSTVSEFTDFFPAFQVSHCLHLQANF